MLRESTKADRFNSKACYSELKMKHTSTVHQSVVLKNRSYHDTVAYLFWSTWSTWPSLGKVWSLSSAARAAAAIDALSCENCLRKKARPTAYSKNSAYWPSARTDARKSIANLLLTTTQTSHTTLTPLGSFPFPDRVRHSSW